MDIRYFFRDLLLVLFFMNFQPGSSFIEDDYEDTASFNRCPWIRNKLKNGRVRYRYKGRVAKFLCDSGYDLAGKRSSTCVRGQWSNPVPVCVARGCSRVPMISNGHVTEMYRGALLSYDCNPGYTLDGTASIHCDGRRWSTTPPVCVVATENPEMSCDFENPDLCGWSHDPNHDFDWKRNQFSTPSGHAGTGPSFDHTFGENKGGYYLYIEASSPRKINDTARLFSPVYSAGLSGGCFHFWYHMFGATTGGLRVYFKPESHVFDELSPNWEKYGDQGNEWNHGSIPIAQLHENFQIVIEGIRGESYVGDSAIDDVSLTTEDCSSFDNVTGIVTHTNADSCRGRCREEIDADSSSSCSCNDNCSISEHHCCIDYATYCFEGNETTVHNTDETSSNFASKTSPITSPATKIISTSSASEQYTSSIATGKTPDLPTSTPETTTLTATSETSAKTATPASTISRAFTKVPLIIHPESTTVLSTTSLMSTTSSQTTRITSSVTSPSTTPRSSSTSMGTTKTSTASTETTASSTVSTTVSSTTTASSTVSTTTSTPSTISTSKTSVQTTLASVAPTSIASEQTTIAPTSPSTTRSTSTVTTTPSRSSSTVVTVISSPLLSTTVAEESTTLSSSAVPSSSTTEPSTRRTYNLRPRTQRTTTPVSTTTYVSTKTSSQSVTAAETSSLASSASSKGDMTTSSAVKSSPTMYHSTRWHISPMTSPYAGTTFQLSSTSSTTKVPYMSTSRSYTRQTTGRYTPKMFRFTSTSSPYAATSESDSYEMGKTKADATSSNSSTPVVISLMVIIVCIIAGVVYYMRKQKMKRQSKLSDDSEMRFLQENDYMDYSDSSALDRILTK